MKLGKYRYYYTYLLSYFYLFYLIYIILFLGRTAGITNRIVFLFYFGLVLIVSEPGSSEGKQ